MAKFLFTEGTKEREMFIKYQRIVQGFYISEEDDSYWEQLHSELIKFEHDYEGISLAKHLAVAMYKAMDEEFNKRKER